MRCGKLTNIQGPIVIRCLTSSSSSFPNGTLLYWTDIDDLLNCLIYSSIIANIRIYTNEFDWILFFFFKLSAWQFIYLHLLYSDNLHNTKIWVWFVFCVYKKCVFLFLFNSKYGLHTWKFLTDKLIHIFKSRHLWYPMLTTTKVNTNISTYIHTHMHIKYTHLRWETKDNWNWQYKISFCIQLAFFVAWISSCFISWHKPLKWQSSSSHKNDSLSLSLSYSLSLAACVFASFYSPVIFHSRFIFGFVETLKIHI